MIHESIKILEQYKVDDSIDSYCFWYSESWRKFANENALSIEKVTAQITNIINNALANNADLDFHSVY